MKTTLHIKNMVCARCKSTVQRILENTGFHIISIQLGEVLVDGGDKAQLQKAEQFLNEQGFEFIRNEEEILIDQIKSKLIRKLNDGDNSNLETFLSRQLHKSYSSLSKLFRKSEGITIEQFYIRLKIERVKELIQIGNMNFSEIAYDLGYTSGSHLSKQFKEITGMTMSEFKSLQNWNRKEFDKIV